MPTHLEELTKDECLELVRSQAVGRIAVARPDGRGPLVVPVNFVLDGDAIVFRSGLGAKLAALLGPASFEVDHVDDVSHTGWSVLFTGRAFQATPWEVGHVHVEPWVSGPKRHWVRLVPDEITGRRIVLEPVEVVRDGRGYL